MTLLRFLIPVLVVVFVAWWFFGRRRSDRPADSGPEAAPDAQTRRTPAAIVSCAHCGVHFPRPDAVEDTDGRAYCCESHRDAGAR